METKENQEIFEKVVNEGKSSSRDQKYDWHTYPQVYESPKKRWSPDTVAKMYFPGVNTLPLERSNPHEIRWSSSCGVPESRPQPFNGHEKLPFTNNYKILPVL